MVQIGCLLTNSIFYVTVRGGRRCSKMHGWAIGMRISVNRARLCCGVLCLAVTPWNNHTWKTILVLGS